MKTKLLELLKRRRRLVVTLIVAAGAAAGVAINPELASVAVEILALLVGE